MARTHTMDSSSSIWPMKLRVMWKYIEKRPVGKGKAKNTTHTHTPAHTHTHTHTHHNPHTPQQTNTHTPTHTHTHTHTNTHTHPSTMRDKKQSLAVRSKTLFSSYGSPGTHNLNNTTGAVT